MDLTKSQTYSTVLNIRQTCDREAQRIFEQHVKDELNPPQAMLDAIVQLTLEVDTCDRMLKAAEQTAGPEIVIASTLEGV